MNALINKLWVSLRLPIHKEFENISLLKIVFELQPLFFDAAMMKEFTDNLCSVKTLPLLSAEVYMEINYI